MCDIDQVIAKPINNDNDSTSISITTILYDIKIDIV